MEVRLATGSSVTTRTIIAFADRLREAAAAADSVVVDVSELEDVDLTFIQAIEVHRGDLARSGRSLALSAQDNRHVASLLARCGYLEGAERSDVAFWTGEESE